MKADYNIVVDIEISDTALEDVLVKTQGPCDHIAFLKSSYNRKIKIQ